MIAGVATSAGVESTARHAHELGFNVVLVDRRHDRHDADAHHNSMTQDLSRGWARPAPRSNCSIFSTLDAKGAPEHAMASQSGLFRWRRVLANAVPHLVSGVMGRPFQSPFAKPPGEGLSSSTVNVLWGFFNLVVGIPAGLPRRRFRSALDRRRGRARAWACCCSASSPRGMFGRFHGGNSPVQRVSGQLRGTFRSLRNPTTGSGPPARWCPMSAPGCSAPRRTGSS